MRNIPFGKPMIGAEERQSVLEVLNGTTLVHGPRVTSFEASFSEFSGAPHSVAVSSCTAGLHLFYLAIGVGAGDEVIVPAQTHVATAHAIEFCGAKPVFVDVLNHTGNIDPAGVEAAVTERTRAISVVHFLGVPVDMDLILSIADTHGLLVVEDCALAIGARYKNLHVGLHGDVGCFSFYPVKHITTAEGGIVITRDQDFAEKIATLRAFGVNRHHGERKIAGDYDVPLLGYNYRMNEIEAAIGLEQIKKLPEFLKLRKQNFTYLEQKLVDCRNISFFTNENEKCQSSYYCFSILLEGKLLNKREEIIQFLNNKGIGTSIYYPKAVPMMKYYKKKYGYSGEEFPNASRISEQTISLPVGPHLNLEDMQYMANHVTQALKIAEK